MVQVVCDFDCRRSRTTSTGQGAWRTTRSAMLPRSTSTSPLRPIEAIMMRSKSPRCAIATISWYEPTLAEQRVESAGRLIHFQVQLSQPEFDVVVELPPVGSYIDFEPHHRPARIDDVKGGESGAKGRAPARARSGAHRATRATNRPAPGSSSARARAHPACVRRALDTVHGESPARPCRRAAHN